MQLTLAKSPTEPNTYYGTDAFGVGMSIKVLDNGLEIYYLCDDGTMECVRRSPAKPANDRALVNALLDLQYYCTLVSTLAETGWKS